MPSPAAPAPFGGLGSFERPSATAPGCSELVFVADNARCMAAAEGWVEGGLERGCGRLLCRTGEVVRDVRGLDVGEGDAKGTRPVEDRSFEVGFVVAEGDSVFRDSSAVFLGAEVFAALLAGNPFSA